MTLLQKINNLTWWNEIAKLKDILKELLALVSGGGVQTITGDGVDNTDPLNPIISTPNLQEVTDIGNTTTVEMRVQEGTFSNFKQLTLNSQFLEVFKNLFGNTSYVRVNSDTIEVNDNTNGTRTFTFNALSGDIGRPYKVYTALLTQTGTNAPVATVLENTLGYEPVFIYSGVGSYSITLQNAPLNTIFIPTFNYSFSTGSMLVLPNDDNDIYMQSLDSSDVNSNDIISSIPLEIRVYN